MVKTGNFYQEMLAKIRPLRRANNSSVYQWKGVNPEEKGKREVLSGVCGGCKGYDCQTRVHLEDGIVTKIDGNPESPLNHGALCGRGNAEIMSLYNPYRVKTPLVRTNPEKGLDVDPMWKEVSWEEALNIVTDRLKKVREKDPRGLVVIEGMGNMESIIRTPFCNAFGTPNLVASRGPLCCIHYSSCLVHSSDSASSDVEYCDYFVTMSASLGANFAAVAPTVRCAKALARGMKLVVVDARSSPEASKGEWIPIRPCTEYAFLLAMAHTIMHEGLKYDVWFMKNRTNAPYLIGPDGDYCRDPVTNKPLMWDAAANQARTFDADFEDIALEGAYTANGVDCRTAFSLVKEEFAKYTPEWAEKITTIRAETIRRISRELVEHARIGSTIDIDGFTFPYRPASVYNRRSNNSHRWGTMADLTGKIVNMLLGNIEVPGGVQGDGIRGPAMVPGEDGVCKPHHEAIPSPFKFPPDHIDGTEFYPNKHTGPHIMPKAILEPEKYYLDYQVEAMIFCGGNPVKSTGQPQVQIDAIKKVPFVVTCGIHIDETAILSDVVLPEHLAIERFVVKSPPRTQQPDKTNYGLHVAYMRQPVPQVFDTKHLDDIWLELAERLGILHGKGGVYDFTNVMNDYSKQYDGYCFKDEDKLELDNTKYTLYDIFDRRLRGWKAGDGRGIDELSKKGFIAHRRSEKYNYPYYYHPDNKTRHPFYFLHLKKTGEQLRADLEKRNLTFPGIENMDYMLDMYSAIPHWVEHPDADAPEEYDLWVINWRTPYFSTDTSNVSANPWLLEINDDDPFEKDGVYMNAATALNKNLKEGDWIVIESLYGKTEGMLYLTERLHPEAVGIPGCRGLSTIQSHPALGKAPNWNELLPLEEKTFDPISGAMECSPRVKVYRK